MTPNHVIYLVSVLAFFMPFLSFLGLEEREGRLTTNTYTAGAGDATATSLRSGAARVALLARSHDLRADLALAAAPYVSTAAIRDKLADFVRRAAAVRAADGCASLCICRAAELALLEREEAAEKRQVGFIRVKRKGGLQGWEHGRIICKGTARRGVWKTKGRLPLVKSCILWTVVLITVPIVVDGIEGPVLGEEHLALVAGHFADAYRLSG